MRARIARMLVSAGVRLDPPERSLRRAFSVTPSHAAEMKRIYAKVTAGMTERAQAAMRPGGGTPA